MVGYFMAAFVVILLMIILVAGLVATGSGDEKVKVKEHSVLHLTLNTLVPERTPSNPLQFIDFSTGESNMPVGLHDLIRCIHQAATDEHIEGIYLDLSMWNSGLSTAKELRNAMLDFKKSGKWIVAYSEMYTKTTYYVASVADNIYLNPAGELIFNGFQSQVTFIKGALEKLGVEMQIIRHGKFKGAVEPFFRDGLSAENHLQIEKYLNSLYADYLADIGASRKIDTAQLRTIANDLQVQSADDALKLKLVDGLWYKDQLLDALKKKSQLEEKDKVILVTPARYMKSLDAEGSGSDKIALIYASGDIGGGQGDDENIGSDGTSEAIRKARLDDKVKAIVLRINSPGGSALASDVIWREVSLCKGKKPVVVSMGDVAASGGYYIACMADTIVAQPTTVTGSIGVFGVIPNTAKLMHEKLGITSDVVKTGKYADLGQLDRPLRTDETEILQRFVDRTYDDFITKVAEGRHMSKADVDSLAQGRVWSGRDALTLGLVDVLGGLDDALKIAASMAHLEKYKVKEMPEQEDPFSKLLKGFSEDATTHVMQQNFGDAYALYQQLRSVQNWNGVQARMPFWVSVK